MAGAFPNNIIYKKWFSIIDRWDLIHLKSELSKIKW